MTTTGTLPRQSERLTSGRRAATKARSLDFASDAVLIDAVRQGDGDAYAALYRRHVGDVRRLARRLARHASEADDVTSEVFAKTLRAIRNGHGPADDALPYLLRSVRHGVTALRRNGDSGRARPADHDEFDLLLDPRTCSDVVFDDEVADAFRQLSGRFQSVLWMTEIEGATPAEVADKGAAGDGTSAGAIASLSHRARCALRRSYLTAATKRHRCTSRSCRSIRDLMPGVVLGDASPGTIKRVHEHTSECDECDEVLHEMASLAASMSTKSLFGLLIGVVGSATASVVTLGPAGLIPAIAASTLLVTALVADSNTAHSEQYLAGEPGATRTAAPILDPMSTDTSVDARRSQTAEPRLPSVVALPQGPASAPTDGEPASTTGPGGDRTPDPIEPFADDPLRPPAVVIDLDTDTEPVDGALDDIPEPVDGALDISEPVGQVLDDITEPVGQVLDDITEPVGQVLDDVTEPVGQVLDDITEPLGEVLDPILEPVGELLGDVSGPVGEVVNDVTEPVTDALAPVTGPVVDAVDDVAGGTVDNVVGPVSNLTGPATGLVGGATDPVVDIVDDVTGQLGSGTIDSVVRLLG